MWKTREVMDHQFFLEESTVEKLEIEETIVRNRDDQTTVVLDSLAVRV
jgi:hypothetical protein